MTAVLPLHHRPAVYAAHVSGFWCCRECEAAPFHCPSCGLRVAVQRPPDVAAPLPHCQPFGCPGCGAYLSVSVAGYRPNPTGEAPPDRSPLSDPLPGEPRRSRPPRPRPCPRSAARAPLSKWESLGLIAGRLRIEPSTVAANYRRVFGCEPARDTSKVATRAYSRRELVLLGVIAPAQGEVVQ